MRRLPVRVDGDCAAGALLIASLVVVVAGYWIGLRGGFLLDDAPNFEQLFRYVDGEIDLRGVIWTNASGPLGRPLSMLSFLVTASVSGMDPWAFRLTNLALHVTNAALVVIVAFLFARNAGIRPEQIRWVASATGVVWVFFPIHVSTVLYPVQRMSQLSTLFVLIGLASFLGARERILRQPTHVGPVALAAAAMGGLTALGALAKENGALLPLLCATMHFFLPAASRARWLNRFFSVCFGVLAILMVYAVIGTDYLDRAYANRDFTLSERLLTQPRVLWDYVLSIVIPNVSQMSLIRDDFPISRSLFEPITTVAAIAAWITLIVACIATRRRWPMVGGGVSFFLAAHSMESSILPLEMVFEHRNYLPSVGLALAIVGAVAALSNIRLAAGTRLQRWAVVGLVFLTIAHAGATHARAVVWSDYRTLLEQAYQQRPSSTRLAGLYFAWLLSRGEISAANAVLDRYEITNTARHPAFSTWRLLAACKQGEAHVFPAYAHWRSSFPQRVDVITLQAAMLLANRAEEGGCPALPLASLAEDYAHWATSLDMPLTSHPAWRLRLLAGRLYASAQRWDQSLAALEDAYRLSGENAGIAVIRFQVAMSAGRPEIAQAALSDLERRRPAWDRRLSEAVATFQRALRPPDQRMP